MPPVVLISLDGVRPDALTAASRHGITSSIFSPMARPLAGIVEVARASEKRVAFFYNWEQLRGLARPGNIHYAYFRDNSHDSKGNDGTVSQATRFIQKERPDLAFVYIGADLSAALPSEYTAILHSDRSHGTDLEEDMLIPWMAICPNIKKSYTIQSEITLLDTAPTIASIMGIQAHHEWEGRSADEIFQ